MQEMNVFTTVDGGRTHIAFDQYYQGSVNSYNNCFTKFFASIFGKTIDVNIGGKTSRFNKSSYLEFLNNHGVNAAKNELGKFRQFSLDSVKMVNKNNGFMRDNLSESKSGKLYGKMVRSLARNDVNEYRVKRLIGKGALMQQHFWVRDGFGVSFGTIKQGLPMEKLEFPGSIPDSRPDCRKKRFEGPR